MQVIISDSIKGKKVLLRYDIDVALEDGQIKEDFKLKAGLETLRLCIENASKVIMIGHLGRPFKTASDEKNGNPPELSAKPIQVWFEKELGIEIFFAKTLEEAKASDSKIVLLENIRFFHGEVPGAEYHVTCTSQTCDIDFAHKLASLGDFYVNEAFSSYRPAVSTTVLPTLLPHAAGLRFMHEVEMLAQARENPQKPFVAIMGGAKVKEKLLMIKTLAKEADVVLVGGKLISEIRDQSVELPKNVMVGKLNSDGFDIAPETTSAWTALIYKAALIVWNGPVGMFEDVRYEQSKKIAQVVISSTAKIVVGGGDTVSLLGSLGLLDEYEKRGLVSVGGGAMLDYWVDGTLPTIEALK